MSQIVVETSVVAKFLFEETDSDRAAQLFTDLTRLEWRITAPPLLRAEVTNVIRRRMRRERLPLAEALAILDDFLALSIVILDDPALYRQALILAESYSLSAYDAQFVALAQFLGCDVWVADAGLIRAIGGRLPFVKWIGDYAPASEQPS